MNSRTKIAFLEAKRAMYEQWAEDHERMALEYANKSAQIGLEINNLKQEL